MADYVIKRDSNTRWWTGEKWDADGEKIKKLKKKDVADLFATWGLGTVDDKDDPSYWQYEADSTPTVIVEEIVEVVATRLD